MTLNTLIEDPVKPFVVGFNLQICFVRDRGVGGGGGAGGHVPSNIFKIITN